jgi:radical SAM-linked protein
MTRQRVRIRFCKYDDLRLIGHRDLMRCMERLFRRAGLKLGMSQGFHPKPRMTFPLALAVGIEGDDEVMELELAEPYTAEELLCRITRQTVPGLAFTSVEVLPAGSKKARVGSVSYSVPIPGAHSQGLAERIDSLTAGPSCLIQRTRGRAPIDLRRCLKKLTFSEGALTMRLKTGNSGSASPREVLAVLGIDEVERHGVHLTRTAVEIQTQ